MGQKYTKTSRRYPFVISRRLLIGLLYSLTSIIIVLPIWHISKYAEKAAKNLIYQPKRDTNPFDAGIGGMGFFQYISFAKAEKISR